MISRWIVWMRVSSSAVTDCRTKASEMRGRSTSTVADARYKFGSETTAAMAAANTTTNTTTPIHLRRRQTSSTASAVNADGESVWKSELDIRESIQERALPGREADHRDDDADEDGGADQCAAIEQSRHREDVIVQPAIRLAA